MLHQGFGLREAPLIQVGDGHRLVGLEGVGVVLAENPPAQLEQLDVEGLDLVVAPEPIEGLVERGHGPEGLGVFRTEMLALQLDRAAQQALGIVEQPHRLIDPADARHEAGLHHRLVGQFILDAFGAPVEDLARGHVLALGLLRVGGLEQLDQEVRYLGGDGGLLIRTVAFERDPPRLNRRGGGEGDHQE